jgi:signal peptidase I
LDYLRKAEEIAPEDPRVHQAIEWAKSQDPLKENKVQQPFPISKAGEKPKGEIETAGIKPAAPDQTLFEETERGPKFQPAIETGQIGTVADETKPQEPQGQESQEKKSLNILKNAGFALLILVLVGLLAIGLFFRIKGQEPEIFGHRVVIVTSGSMEPVFQAGSIILINTQSEPPYQAGDVVMFSQANQTEMNVTHRIIDVTESEGGRYYQTKGDNNAVPDQELITSENILGLYAGFTIPYLGYFFSFIRSREGMLLLAILFGLYLVITQAFRIKELLAGEDAPIDAE